MVIPPVLERELRSAARYWGTYWIRVGAGSAMILALGGLLLLRSKGSLFDDGLTPASAGALLFGILHTVLTVTFAWLCPVLTADCISRERREGTLGLLFLTPLNAWDVVAGKGMAHVLRAFGLWLSTIPFLAIPFLMGGIRPGDFARAVAIELSVVLVGLAAGFLATARTTRWASAMLCALGYSVLLWIPMLAICSLVARSAMLAGMPPNTSMPEPEFWLVAPFAILFASVAAGAVSASGWVVSVPAWVMAGVDASLVAVGQFAILVFAGSVFLTGTVLARSRKAGRSMESGDRDRRRAWRWGRSRARRWLEENPIRWLQAWSPLLRWGRLGWLGAVLLLWGMVGLLARLESHFEYVGWAFPPVLLLSMALAAAGRFRQEVEEGTLELLLVTTLPPRRLVTGRARALWATFGPALAASMAIQLVFIQPSDVEGWWYEAQLVLVAWLTLPMVGMRCAMRRLHPMLGWVLVLAWGVVAPMGVAGVLTAFTGALFDRADTETWVLFAALSQGVASLWWGRMTVWDLKTRNFMKRPLQRRAA